MQKTISYILIVFLGFAALMTTGAGAVIISVEPVSAAQQIPYIPKPDTLPGPNKESQQNSKTVQDYFLQRFIPNLDKGFLTFVALAAVTVLIIGSIQLLTAYGDDEKVTKGKQTITWAIVGLVIAMLSYAIVSIITSLPLEKPQEDRAEETAGETP